MPSANTGPPPPLGFVLRHMREEAGWTQAQLEAAADLPATAVSKMERGIRSVSRIEIEGYARIMGHPEDWVDRTLAAADQLPRRQPPDDSPTALSEVENRVVEGLALAASRRLAGAVRKKFGPVLQAARWQTDRKAAGKVWKRLSRATKEDRIALVVGASEFQTWAVCERLCEESVRAASHDAGQTREIADLALFVAERSPGSPKWHNQLMAYAWAFVGNSWKVLGDPREAEKAMSISSGLWVAPEGSEPSPLDRAIPLALRARLLIEKSQYDTALFLIEEALPIAGSRLTRLRLLIDRGSVLRRTGAYGMALSAYQEASKLATTLEEKRLLWAITFNEALCACDLKDFQGASTRLGMLRHVAFEHGRAIEILRLRWLEAKIAAGQGRLGEAATELGEIWQSFSGKRMWLDAAKAAIELAAVELELGNSSRVKILATASAEVFAALVLPEPLFQGVQLFWESARREAAAADTARHLLEALQMRGGQRPLRAVPPTEP